MVPLAALVWLIASSGLPAAMSADPATTVATAPAVVPDSTLHVSDALAGPDPAESVLAIAIENGAVAGRLTSREGDPLAGQSVHVVALAVSGPGLIVGYEVTGTVLAGAERMDLGYRVNTECVCSGSAGITVYGARYAERGNSRSLVPNGDFARQWDNWGARGAASLHLRVRLGSKPEIGIARVGHTEADEIVVGGETPGDRGMGPSPCRRRIAELVDHRIQWCRREPVGQPLCGQSVICGA